MPDEHPIMNPDDCPDRDVLDGDNILCDATDGSPDNYDCPVLLSRRDCPRGLKRPIVERPEWVDWRQIENRDLSGHDKVMGQRYIRHLEGSNATLLNEVHQAKAIIEGLTAERDQAESKAKDFELIIRSHHKDI